MELTIVDRLLVCLADQTRNVPMAMRATGYSEDEMMRTNWQRLCARVTK